MTCMSIAFAQLPSEINHKESRTNALSLTDELMSNQCVIRAEVEIREGTISIGQIGVTSLNGI